MTKSHKAVAQLIALNVQRYTREKPGRNNPRQHRMSLSQLRLMYGVVHLLPKDWFTDLQFELSEIGFVLTRSCDTEIVITAMAYVDSMVKLSIKRVALQCRDSDEDIDTMFKAEYEPATWKPPVREIEGE